MSTRLTRPDPDSQIDPDAQIDHDTADLVDLVKELAVVRGEVTLASGRTRTTTSTCAGSPWTARPPPWSGG